MGVDWIRMRPHCSADAFAAAARAQRAAFVASGWWFPDEFGHLRLPPAVARDGTGLSGLVDVDTRPGRTHRVNAFVLSPLLPAEWRFAAYRSYLPDELGRCVRKWHAHVAEVRDGQHRDHLRAWHAYKVTRDLASEWATLRRVASDARGRTNAWAVRPGLTDVRDRILALPTPPVSPAPLWGGRCETHEVDSAPYVELAREWNRRVPSNRKVSVPAPPSFEDFLDDPYLDDTLHWMKQTAEDGYGLLLDW